jgi:hypothetical protein
VPADTLDLTFGKGINIDHAERVIAQAAQELGALRPIRLDFSASLHIDAGVGWRIAGILRPFGERHLITAIVPPIKDKKDFQNNWFRPFTRTGLGHALAIYATEIISNGINVTEMVREFYRESGVVSRINFASISDLTSPSAIDTENYDSFVTQFRKLLYAIGLDSDTARLDSLSAISKLCFESIQNIRDHADRAPLPQNTKISSRFSLSYFKELSVAGLQGDFRGFVERTRAAEGEGTSEGGFVEAVVTDDGVGIAARHGLSGDVYEKSSDKERALLQSALMAGESVKLLAGDSTVRGDPGYGFSYIADNLKALRAYATLRTGRLAAVFDSTAQSSSAFALLPDDLGRIHGTTLHIVFPKPSLQLRLPGL